ncbi:MAG: NAD(P)/FAD-dependent oxidoreductase [Candidatus Freyrarchaeum guaymaensis]
MGGEYDVVVVGSAFAGAVAAKTAAEKGLRVLLLERSTEPGEKIVSGGILTHDAFNEPGLEFLKDAPLERELRGVRWIMADEHGEVPLDFTFRSTDDSRVGYTIYCYDFCKWLTQLAVDAGAQFRNNTTAVDVIKQDGAIKGVVTEHGEKINSQVVIAADGAKSLIGIRAGIRRKYPPENIENCVVLDFTISESDIRRLDLADTFEVYFGTLTPADIGSYVWIFPYKQSFHLGVGALVSSRKNPTIFLQRFLKSKLWKDRFEDITKLRAWMWNTVPLWSALDREKRMLEKTHGNGILIAGDAAGFLDSFTCAGFYGAMVSGMLAGETAAEAISKGDVSEEGLSTYEEKYKNRLIWRLMQRPWRRDLIAAIGGQKIIQLSSNISNYIVRRAFDQPKPSDLMFLLTGLLPALRYIGPFLNRKLPILFDELMLLTGVTK